MTGDVGEDFNAHREFMREKRAGNLENAKKAEWPVAWIVHTPYHWSCKLNGKRLDYWPTRCKFQYDGRIMTGGVKGFINKRLEKAASI